MTDRLDQVAALVAAARRAGADAADAVLFTGASLSVQRRLGKLEQLERSEAQDVGLRAFVGRRSAIVSATSLDPARFAQLAERAVGMARAVPEDPFGGLPEPAEVPSLDLDLQDAAEPDADALLARAAAAEEAALAVPGVTNSEGADAGWSRSEILLATSTGFAGRTVRTGHSVSVTALAGSGTGMERDYDYASAVHLADLDDAATLGRKAGEWAVRRLNPRRPATATLPAVFDPRVAGSLLGHLAGAINGAAVARRTTFLKDALGTRVFAPGINVHDDPHRRRGLRSRVFDGEGQSGRARAVIEDGVLTTWLLDTRSARQLGLASTGHASRGVSGQPSPAPSNLWLAPGTLTPAALMGDISVGLYVTEMLGMGVNGVTGDYSRGAAGFMIRNGELAEPVSEITVAGRLQDMFARLAPANDLRFRRGTDAPTVRIDGMTVAGA
jgi:PmbA protein